MNKKLTLLTINVLLLHMSPNIQAGRTRVTKDTIAPTIHPAVSKCYIDEIWRLQPTAKSSEKKWNDYFASQKGLRTGALEFHPRPEVVRFAQARKKNKEFLSNETIFPSLKSLQ